ncbi:unnamed protein product [Microthlaspi erraticum]|uniref:No apical meristem-associated C-terminal domain-containing protein n=1 Tax=Microthlaspi erraticum TaxID=1685480 RepID=A0A6D2JX22_9BRAS|nr:unnamed protein product [Microthlaspi erraticum]
MNQTDTAQTPSFCTQNTFVLYPKHLCLTSSTADDGDGVDESSPLATREVRRRWTNAVDFMLDFPPCKFNTCRQRWTKINEGVQKFCGCFDQASRQATSGQSEDDVFQMAYKFYYQDQKTNFILEYAWRVLRNDQKWCSLTRDKGKTQSKRAQPHDFVDVCPMEEQVEERPIGVKAAKAENLKGKKTVKRTSEDRRLL